MNLNKPEKISKNQKYKKPLLVLQIVAMIIFAGGFVGMLATTDIYDDIHDTIVSTLCLSCIKLDPKSNLDFIFETANEEDHPQFVLENLTTGIIFIEYRSDVCKACDDMAPVIKDIFQLSFEKEDTLYEMVNYNGTIVHFFHINLDHATDLQEDSFAIYDKDNVMGVPMFVIISVNYNRGIVQPCYTSAYGTVGEATYGGRRTFITDMLNDGIKLYDLNHEGYHYP